MVCLWKHSNNNNRHKMVCLWKHSNNNCRGMVCVWKHSNYYLLEYQIGGSVDDKQTCTQLSTEWSVEITRLTKQLVLPSNELSKKSTMENSTAGNTWLFHLRMEAATLHLAQKAKFLAVSFVSIFWECIRSWSWGSINACLDVSQEELKTEAHESWSIKVRSMDDHAWYWSRSWFWSVTLKCQIGIWNPSSRFTPISKFKWRSGWLTQSRVRDGFKKPSHRKFR